uniref:Peroxidase n=2 Tax=Solanum tuberosum TaxID=4113 RepID=M1AYE6_SOLTU
MFSKNWALMAVFSFLVICLVTTMAAHAEVDPGSASGFPFLLRYGYYDDKCEDLEDIVWSKMKTIVQLQHNAPAQLLRLMFHDCFIGGCDASVLLADRNENGTVEREAIPNRTLKGFNFIDTIKDEIEEECPGVVSCSDILVLATRDGIVLAGGPYYPVLTGRRDSKESFFDKAMAEIPQPNGNIIETLRLFSLRGFDERETVALLELRRKCPDDNNTISNMLNDEHTDTARGLSVSIATSLDNHYYKTLMRGRGLLFADQQLMANEKTAAAVTDYAIDDGIIFRTEFAHAMGKLSNFGVLTGSEGEVRHSCSHLNS